MSDSVNEHLVQVSEADGTVFWEEIMAWWIRCCTFGGQWSSKL